MMFLRLFLLSLGLALVSQASFAQSKVLNPGEAIGQLIFLSSEDVLKESPKFKSMHPLSIPVFAELPMDLSVVAGAITLKQQNLLSHVQLKSRARHTPNLDISQLPEGMSHPLLKDFIEGDWMHMTLGQDGSVKLEKSTEALAVSFFHSKRTEPVKLTSDTQTAKIFKSSELSSLDANKVGSKAANYGELARALNTPQRIVVRPAFALPFHYYQEFLDANPAIKSAIEGVLSDPLMNKIGRVSYRQEKLKAIRDMIRGPAAVVSQSLINELLGLFDKLKTPDGLPLKMKLRSSTNSEDLPNFNGAGLYESASYKPTSAGGIKVRAQKEDSLKNALTHVWASVWNLRAFEERTYFQIPHGDVKMGIQINPAFGSERASGVVVTRNILNDPKLTSPGVYIEAQRGDEYSVANPVSGITPEKLLVTYDKAQPLDQSRYQVVRIQKSNISDSGLNILDHENPVPVMSDAESKDLAWLCLKAEVHFKPILGKDKPDFSLDLEFKIDTEDTGSRQVYLKQARPYID